MDSPLDSLLQSLHDITTAYKEAHNNGCTKEELDGIMEVLNEYYFSVQLIASHLDVPVKFTRLVNARKGKVLYKQSQLDKHLNNIDKRYFIKSQVRELKKELIELSKTA